MPKTASTTRRKLAAAKAHDLATLVKYSEGSIVSRTLAENKAGSLTLFAFDAGQGLSEHSAPYDAVVQVMDALRSVGIVDFGLQLEPKAGSPR